jgi:hypothetical protein
MPIASATPSQIQRRIEGLRPPGDGAGKLRDAVLVAEIRHHGVDGILPRRVLGDLVQKVGDQASLHPFVDLGEAGADPGLQREAPQDGGAEGVDRLDLQPARRLDGAGKERARARQEVRGQARPGTPTSASASRSSSSGVIAQSPRRLNSRFCISIAAALV